MIRIKYIVQSKYIHKAKTKKDKNRKLSLFDTLDM